MGFKLDVNVPVNGRVRQGTITARDEAEKIPFTDKADLVSIKERQKLAKRLADRLGTDPAAVGLKLQTAWAAQVERRREHERAQEAVPAAAAVSPQGGAGEESHLSELGNARRLVQHFGRDFRHCHPWRKDLVYDGRRWCEDTTALVTNHRPEIRGTDHGIWRRIRLIPFTVRIPDAEQDKDLPNKLRQELPGILAWCVAGCRLWQEEGLEPPEEVRDATECYRAGQDVLGEFLAQCCDRHADLKVRAGAVYGACKEGCERGGEQAASQRRSGRR
jgi:hypothetical protein